MSSLANVAPDMVSEERTIIVDERDRQVLESVDGFLQDAIALKTWYDATLPSEKFAERFDLARTQNRANRSFGFFDSVETPSGVMPVMGNYQEMFYDQPGAMSDFTTHHKIEWRNQVREFVLRYFMRISNFSQPIAFISSGYPKPSSYTGGLSWCLPQDSELQGFGFSQLYYKCARSGDIFKFPDHEEYAIVDLRDIGVKYEWLVLKVRIFDFDVRLKPLGEQAPEFSFELNEESYLVVSRDFIVNEDDAHGHSRYGFGYAFIRSPEPEFTAYGPGEFDAAFESIIFDLSESGTVTVQMGFVANRPHQVAKLEVKPVDWGFRLADSVSMGMASRLFSPVKASLGSIRLGSIDPVYTYVSLANALTAGQAADALCISREQLDKRFLLQHFTQHYQTIIGTLLTWRQIPNWLDTDNLPNWVRTGGLIDD